MSSAWEIEMLSQAGAIAVHELQAELRAQDHYASGDLHDSLEYGWKIAGNEFVVWVEMEFYGDYVNRGRKRGEKKVPIDALEEWIRQRRFEAEGDEQIRRLAFAIQTQIYKEGIPTGASKSLSRTGKRTEFIDDATKRIEDEILEPIAEGVTQFFFGEIAEIEKQINE